MQSKPYSNAVFPGTSKSKSNKCSTIFLILHFHYQHIGFQNGDQSIASIFKEGTTQPALYVLIFNSHHNKTQNVA